MLIFIDFYAVRDLFMYILTCKTYQVFCML